MHVPWTAHGSLGDEGKSNSTLKLNQDNQDVDVQVVFLPALELSSFRMSPELNVDPGETVTTVILTRDKKGIHVIQFLQPLTQEQRYYSVEITACGKLLDLRVICSVACRDSNNSNVD